MVIETSNWWVGKSVLIAPEWTSRISWLDRKVYVGITRDAIKRSPEWAAKEPISRAFEDRLYRHYERMPLRRRTDHRASEGGAV
jgi:hypothetical protein